MPLVPGTRLGPYEVVAALGAGGMGEVYKARDTRLARTVAIKVLPEAMAADADLRARFEREARAIAALQHPHICVLHDIGHHEGTDYLVMEYLEGETLADRLAKLKAPLRLAQVLALGVEIADALDKAHRAGIVHRDLKPANIMLTKAGAKLLDFGLAKLKGPAVPISLSGITGTTTAALGTAQGTILGTIHYMAPEQVEGREADRRADIWALGAVLYEMATGTRAFDGASAASVIGAILKDEPPAITARQQPAPPALDDLIHRCLAKDADERWQDAGDVRRQLQWIATAGSQPSAGTSAPTGPAWRAAAGWVVAAGLAVVLAAAGAVSIYRGRPAGFGAERMAFSIAPPDEVQFVGSFALSPDGRHLAFVGLGTDGPAALWVRTVDSLAAQRIPGTDDATFPFWSPSSDTIGFFANGKLRATPISRGTVKTLATAPNGRGGSWGTDGTILFVPDTGSPVFRIAESGGTPTPVTTLDPTHHQSGHRWPAFVDATHFTYSVQGSADSVGIYLGALGSADTSRLVTAYSNSAVVDRHLLYVADNVLVRQALDSPLQHVVGEATEVVGPVVTTGGLGFAAWSVSSTGQLAYTPGAGSTALVGVEWVARRGGPTAALNRDAAWSQFNSFFERFTTDGRLVASSIFRTATADIWLFNIERGVASRVTFSDANDINPVLSPDATRLLFASNGRGPYNMYVKPTSGEGGEHLLHESASTQYPTDWTPDGRTILFTNLDASTQADLWTMPAAGDAPPTLFLATPFNEYAARVSPDGKWVAYTSDESGRPEVYVQRFPSGGEKAQISIQGGSEPQWRADGRELFYLAANRTITGVPITTAPAFSAGRPVKLSDTVVNTTLGSFHSNHFAPTPDGQRFLANVSNRTPFSVAIILNWSSAPKP